MPIEKAKTPHSLSCFPLPTLPSPGAPPNSPASTPAPLAPRLTHAHVHCSEPDARTPCREQKKEMRHQYEPGLGGTGDGPPDVRPSTAGPPSSSSSQRTATLRTRLPGCSSTSVVMQASAGPHRDAGPFTPRARAGAGMDQTSTSTSHYPSHGGKGVPPPKWAHRSRFEPSLGEAQVATA